MIPPLPDVKGWQFLLTTAFFIAVICLHGYLIAGLGTRVKELERTVKILETTRRAE